VATKASRQIVIGPARSGFALLLSVLAQMSPLRARKSTLRKALLELFATHLGNHISEQIVAVFAREGLSDDLVFNPNFRALLGGPRWAQDGKRACYRKYIGARGRGDLMLIVAHPLALFDCDDIIHSHVDPAWWASQTVFPDSALHASVRNPAGIVNSSCFSLNALASEHIQKFMPPDQDNDLIRQEIALYKLSDIKFFEGIVRFYAKAFADFLPVRDKFAVMRWEELILNPVPAIQRVADAAGTPIGASFAAQIWERLDHVNLTGDHRHNYRAGKGIVGDWRNWLTNQHLDILRRSGLEDMARTLGYGAFEPLDERAYTPFQARLHGLIARGEIHKADVDADLFGYAFNKSNIDASQFNFRQHKWRDHTWIERSTYTDVRLEQMISDAAEESAARMNKLFDNVLAVGCDNEREMLAELGGIKVNHAGTLRPYLPARYDAAFAEAAAMITNAFAGGGGPAPIEERRPPLLLYSSGGYNLVAHQGRFFCIPQSLGPIDLEREDVTAKPGVLVAPDLQRLESRLGSALGAVREAVQ
jgi:Sulfotransferase domain